MAFAILEIQQLYFDDLEPKKMYSFIFFKILFCSLIELLNRQLN